MRKVLAVVIALLAAGAFAARADNYPSRVITLVVPSRWRTGRHHRVFWRSGWGPRSDANHRHRKYRRRRRQHRRRPGRAFRARWLHAEHRPRQTRVFNAAMLKLDYDVVKDFHAGFAHRGYADLDRLQENLCRPATSKVSSAGSRPRTARRRWERSASIIGRPGSLRRVLSRRRLARRFKWVRPIALHRWCKTCSAATSISPTGKQPAI